jgi:AraC family transcriptional regulator
VLIIGCFSTNALFNYDRWRFDNADFRVTLRPLSMTACSPFQGTRLKEWGSPLVRLSETSYRPRYRTTLHAHENVTLVFVMTGGFVERQGSRSIECGPASVVVRPPSMEHDNVFVAAGGRCFNIEVPFEFVAGRSLPSIDCHAGPAVWAACRMLVAAHRDAEIDPLAIESQVADLVDALCTTVSAKPSTRMSRVACALADRFAEPWSLAALAHEAQLHPMHFARVFREAHGESVGTYVHRLRVEYAARQLARTSIPIAEIATDAGFADQAHLTRVFRRRTGATPARFRAVFRDTSALRSFKTS